MDFGWKKQKISHFAFFSFGINLIANWLYYSYLSCKFKIYTLSKTVCLMDNTAVAGLHILGKREGKLIVDRSEKVLRISDDRICFVLYYLCCLLLFFFFFCVSNEGSIMDEMHSTDWNFIYRLISCFLFLSISIQLNQFIFFIFSRHLTLRIDLS